MLKFEYNIALCKMKGMNTNSRNLDIMAVSREWFFWSELYLMCKVQASCIDKSALSYQYFFLSHYHKRANECSYKNNDKVRLISLCCPAV